MRAYFPPASNRGRKVPDPGSGRRRLDHLEHQDLLACGPLDVDRIEPAADPLREAAMIRELGRIDDDPMCPARRI